MLVQGPLRFPLRRGRSPAPIVRRLLEALDVILQYFPTPGLTQRVAPWEA